MPSGHGEKRASMFALVESRGGTLGDTCVECKGEPLVESSPNESRTFSGD